MQLSDTGVHDEWTVVGQVTQGVARQGHALVAESFPIKKLPG